MKIIFTLLILFFNLILSQGQEIKKISTGGYHYQLGDDFLNISDLDRVLESNEEAHRLLYDARQYRGISQILGFTGGALIGYQLGNLIAGKDFDNVQGFLGAGLIAIAIPINIRQTRKIETAVDIYNSGLNPSSEPSAQLSFISTGTSIGLSLRF
ncbi:hypothetical protein JCM19275_2181 [Nonlabens ulvanivorans]|uniref:Uncharacterized protein n=1 Tax=Nonlabens ulvanivorans TaxID=906888 RepID=A0A090WKY6_NONUL|nr:hypothetical protein [Nonlabens ulvanivorans]GAL76049.1 hypothetical protein JCM19275_2181 [Nonlabens ulvanivorans]